MKFKRKFFFKVCEDGTKTEEMENLINGILVAKWQKMEMPS